MSGHSSLAMQHSGITVDVLFEYPALNGGERSWMAALDGLRQAGFILRAIVPSYTVDDPHPLASELLKRKVECRQLDYYDAVGVRRPLTAIRTDLEQLLRDDSPQLLHANSLSTARIAGPVCRELRLRSLGHLRDIITLGRQAIADVCCHDRLLAVSQATRNHHAGQGVPAEKMRVCYNGVDLNEFRPLGDHSQSMRRMFGDEVCPLVSIGQISLRKGFDTIAAACELMFGENPRLHWLVVGQRHSRKPETVEFDSALRSRTSRPPLAGRVHFLGVVGNMSQLLPQCDVLIHAARQEPLGRVLLEAAACEVPVVATDVGGTREIFCEHLSLPQAAAARLVPAEDPSAIASAVCETLANPRGTREQAGRARQICRRRFDIVATAAELAAHYRATLDGGDAAVG